MEAIGQTLDGRALTPTARDRNLSYREQQAVRAERLKPVYNEAGRRLRGAESARSMALDALGTVTTEFLLGEATEEDIAEVEREIEEAERAIRRWGAAVRELDDRRGVVRDPNGHRL